MSEGIKNENNTTNSTKAIQSNQKMSLKKKIGNYILLDELGKGTFSKVILGNHILTNQKVAIKVLEKDKIKDRIDIERINREIQILKTTTHPNISKLYETVSTMHNYYLIMEFIEGGDLFDYIYENTRIPEKKACSYFRQLISSLIYIHKLGVSHRDIKPENILLNTSKDKIKLIDFGLSNICGIGQFLYSSCGSPCYASPEMISGTPYNGLGTDLWSCGVVLYCMLVGCLPFDDDDIQCLYQKILKGEFVIPSSLSCEAIDLLKRILEVDPTKRITLEEIENHKWFNLDNGPLHKDIGKGVKLNYDQRVIKLIKQKYFICLNEDESSLAAGNDNSNTYLANANTNINTNNNQMIGTTMNNLTEPGSAPILSNNEPSNINTSNTNNTAINTGNNLNNTNNTTTNGNMNGNIAGSSTNNILASNNVTNNFLTNISDELFCSYIENNACNKYTAVYYLYLKSIGIDPFENIACDTHSNNENKNKNLRHRILKSSASVNTKGIEFKTFFQKYKSGGGKLSNDSEKELSPYAITNNSNSNHTNMIMNSLSNKQVLTGTSKPQTGYSKKKKVQSRNNEKINKNEAVTKLNSQKIHNSNHNQIIAHNFTRDHTTNHIFTHCNNFSNINNSNLKKICTSLLCKTKNSNTDKTPVEKDKKNKPKLPLSQLPRSEKTSEANVLLSKKKNLLLNDTANQSPKLVESTQNTLMNNTTNFNSLYANANLKKVKQETKKRTKSRKDTQEKNYEKKMIKFGKPPNFIITAQNSFDNIHKSKSPANTASQTKRVHLSTNHGNGNGQSPVLMKKKKIYYNLNGGTATPIFGQTTTSHMCNGNINFSSNINLTKKLCSNLSNLSGINISKSCNKSTNHNNTTSNNISNKNKITKITPDKQNKSFLKKSNKNSDFIQKLNLDNIVHRVNMKYNNTNNNIYNNNNILSNTNNNFYGTNLTTNPNGIHKITFSRINKSSIPKDSNTPNNYTNGNLRLYTMTKSGLKTRGQNSRSKNKNKNILLEKFSL